MSGTAKCWWSPPIGGWVAQWHRKNKHYELLVRTIDPETVQISVTKNESAGLTRVTILPDPSRYDYDPMALFIDGTDEERLTAWSQFVGRVARSVS